MKTIQLSTRWLGLVESVRGGGLYCAENTTVEDCTITANHVYGGDPAGHPPSPAVYPIWLRTNCKPPRKATYEKQ